MNKLKLHLEYLTKLSVKIDMDKTSINLDSEYIIGMIKWFFFKNGKDIKLAKQSTSLQHKFRPCPPTGCNLWAVSPRKIYLPEKNE